MKVIATLNVVKNYLYHNKKRSLLALLGVALGVFSLVVTSGVSGAMSQTLLAELGKMGSQVITVTNGDVKAPPRPTEGNQFLNLTRDDALFISQKVSFIHCVAPYKETTQSVSIEGQTFSSSLKGVDTMYALISDLTLQSGRFITSYDNENLEQVAVIGASIASEYFGTTSGLGKNITIGNNMYRIVGVLASQGGSSGGEDRDSKIYVPLTTVQKRLAHVTYIDGFLILPNKDSISLIKDIESLLLKRHGKKDFSVVRYEEMANTGMQAGAIFSKLTLISAVIAFSVGALGITAIMYLSVYERLIEIGIRRTFGATKKEIFLQFMLESLILATIGALGGLLCASLIVLIVEVLGGFVLFLPWNTMFIAMVSSISVGVLSGIYPAIQALKVDPKEILTAL